MDEISFPKITKSMLDVKKVKKKYKQKFEFLSTICRFKLFKEHHSRFQRDSLKICNIVGDTLRMDRTFDTGNQFFIFSIMECHFDFIQSIVPKINGVIKDAIPQYLDVIHDKNENMIKLLEQNIKEPITQEELKRFVQEQQEKENEIIGSDNKESGK